MGAIILLWFSSVQLLSHLCDPMDHSTPGLCVHHQLWSLTKLMSIELVMPSNHLILCRPLLLLPSTFPSIRVFFSESVLCIRWPRYWSFSFNISPSNEHPGLISFRMDWLDLLAVPGTLKSLLHEIKRRLLLGRKVMTNLDSILKIRDITLPTKVCLVKAMIFPLVIYGCKSWTVKKAER